MLQFLPVMDVILLEDIDKLGKAGAMVDVKPGYARNYLLPQQLAAFVNASNLKVFKRKEEKLKQEAEEKRGAAQANKTSLEDAAKVVVKAKSGESGKLFGSITKDNIAEAIKTQHNIEVDKHKIEIKDAIKNLGEYKARINLGSATFCDIIVEVVADN